MAEYSYHYDCIIKTIIIGDQGIGKTALMRRYCDTCFSSDYQSTIGVEFRARTVQIGGKMATMKIWDTAGQERFRTITRAYYRGAMGIILCYAINDRESFGRLESWMEEIRKEATDVVCIVLVGIKSDLHDERVVSIDEGRQFAEAHGIKFFETSAKEDVNVDEVFLTLTRDIIKVFVEKKGDILPEIKLRENNDKVETSCFKCS